MKLKKLQLLLLATVLFIPFKLLAQNCEEHHMIGDCRFDLQRGFKVYSQSTSVSISPLDTLELNAIFYGQKDYVISFCTHRKLYPVHFVLIDQQTNQVLYDNEEDKYLESLGVGFDVTRSLRIRVNVLARESSEEEVKENLGCLGMLVQYKNYPKKKVMLKM